MSRIGKKPIAVPNGVTVKIQDSVIDVKGSKGEMSWKYPHPMIVKLEGNEIIVERPTDSKNDKSLHGLTRNLINNIVIGVTTGYVRDLELVGVGYRATGKPKSIEFALGYSHPVEFPLPDGITAEVDKKQTKITLKGIDKQLLGQVAANIRSLRPPDAYKGKGIRYADERIKLKPGKTGTK